MKLNELINGICYTSTVGDIDDREVESIEFDSRKVQANSMFVAIEGGSVDGHQYISGSIARGATVILCEVLPHDLVDGVTYICVADSNITLGLLANNFYGSPSRRLKLVGITGTNGKTTTATLLYDLFKMLGYKVGLISTVIYRIHDQDVESTHTTPDALSLNKLLSEMVDVGCEYCFMEVSSHSIVQGRISGLEFVGGVFSNITHDHLDYHKTFAEYIRAKKMFFDTLPKGSFALVNADDKNGGVMVQNCVADVYKYSLQSVVDFRCKISEMLFDGMLLSIDSVELWVSFLGRFNAYNLLSVYGTAILLGADKGEVLCAMSGLRSVTGRFEYVRSESGLTAIVDYAHTPDALENVISTINEIRTLDQKLFVVVGCGGDRDSTKRPKMARIAAADSDLAILTSDNPRFEKPDDILTQMRAGLDPRSKYLVISDRREAIKSAVMMAGSGDIILVAGKGHETYQDIQGVKHHFDDKEELLNSFEIAKN